MSLDIKPASECAYDILSMGEIMLRLDPGDGRVRTTRTFQAWEGGGEYNVARGLRRCFGKRAAVLTGFVDTLKHEKPLPPPWITGHDLLGLGISEGPDVGRWHRLAYDAQLESRFETRDELLDWIRKELAEVNGEP